MVSRIRNGTARPLLALLAITAYLSMPGLGIGGVATAIAQTDDLGRARGHYEFAEFDQALAILDGMIAAGGPADETMRDAQILRARCHVGLGNRNLAEEAFCEALAIDPDWRPDPVFFPRSEVQVFETAQATCPEPAMESAEPAPVVAPVTRSSGGGSTPWYKKPLVWAGAAAAVVVAAVALGGGGDDGGDSGPPDLPPPPDPPEDTK